MKRALSSFGELGVTSTEPPREGTPVSTASPSGSPAQTHRLVLGGHLLGCGIQGRSGLGTEPARGHHHHLALLGRELGEHVGLEAPQHDRLLQQQLQLPQVGGAGVIPAPGVLWRRPRQM